MTREEYVAKSLRNEAEAQAALFEHHRETRKAGSGEHEAGYQQYHGAYNEAYDRIQAEHPELTPDQIHARAREEGIQALTRKFSELTPSTSYPPTRTASSSSTRTASRGSSRTRRRTTTSSTRATGTSTTGVTRTPRPPRSPAPDRRTRRGRRP